MTRNSILPPAMVTLALVILLGWTAAGIRAQELSGASFKVPPGQAYKTVIISKPIRVRGDVVVPANVSLRFEHGGVLDVAERITLTINGSIEAPLQPVFQGPGKVRFGPGRVERVFPQWWGARGDGKGDNTAAIQSAIDSIRGGIVFFPAGRYMTRGVTTQSNITFQGEGPGASTMQFTPDAGACITLPKDCSSFRLQDMSLRGRGANTAYGIDGTNEYVRYFSMRNFFVTGFKIGIYIQQGMHISLDYGYVGCYGMGKANGTIGLKLGDKALNKGCTTATVKDIYFTNAETDFYNRAAPCLLIRPIFETCSIGLDNYARAVALSPFMEACTKADMRTADNGMLFIGPSERHYKFVYAQPGMRARTSWIPDTFDCPAKLGPLEIAHNGEITSFLKRHWSSGAAVPTTGKWAIGDIRWNTFPSSGGPPGWICTEAGTPGTWQPIGTGHLVGSAHWDPPPLRHGARATRKFVVLDARLEDFALISPGINVKGLTVSATVTAPGRVTVVLANQTGKSVDLKPSTWKIRVVK